jgi:predicted nucleic acid-binding protein
MYLLGDAAGWTAQAALWQMVERSALELVDLDPVMLSRTRVLMQKYVDLPASLADASLIAVAEVRGLRRVFTLDSNFTVYRAHGRLTFETIP